MATVTKTPEEREAELRKLVKLCIRIASDAARPKKSYLVLHPRILVKGSLIEDLRKLLDRLGYAEDWRTLHDLVRIEERTPHHTKQGARIR